MTLPASTTSEVSATDRASWRELWITVGVVLFSLAGFMAINHGQRAWLDYFVPLADAFLHGRLWLGEHPGYLNELIPQNGRFYVVYPPMPAVLLLPAVAIWGPGFDQARASILVGGLAILAAMDVLARLGLRGCWRAGFGLTLGFGTIFWFSVQWGSSWHFAHVCATLFLWLAIRQSLVGTKPWLTGLLVGCAALSRLPTLMGAVYFAVVLVAAAWRLEGALRWKQLARDGALFALGLSVPLLLLGAYNAARFGSPFQSGYMLIPGIAAEYQYRFGLMHPINVLRNLEAMLFVLPERIAHFPFFQAHRLGGLSLLLTTPVFLWALRSSWRQPRTWAGWAAVLLIAAPILLHADLGGDQFGYRYAQDFYPFLALLTAQAIGDRPWPGALAAIALGWLVNLWGIYVTLANLRV